MKIGKISHLFNFKQNFYCAHCVKKMKRSEAYLQLKMEWGRFQESYPKLCKECFMKITENAEWFFENEEEEYNNWVTQKKLDKL